MSSTHNPASNARQLGGQSYRRLTTKRRYGPHKKIHVWHGESETCWCGKLDRDDPRLEEIQPGEGRAALCGRCDWHCSWSDVHLAYGQAAVDALARGDYELLRRARERLQRWDYKPGEKLEESDEHQHVQ